MSISSRVKDGLSSLLNNLANRRSASNSNRFSASYIDRDELRQIFKNGTANKIYRIKSGSALSGTMGFESTEAEEFYRRKLSKAVHRACMFQLGFGRGIVVIQEQGADLSQPLPDNFDKSTALINTFSGDMVTVSDVVRDLADERYLKPNYYVVRGESIHWSRVADFTYVEPVEYEAPYYQWGGIPEAELIYDQLINDSIVQRSSASIIEKNSTIFYKVKDFKQNLMSKNEEGLLRYFSTLEDSRSIYGAGIIDSEDDVVSVTQALSNLKEVDDVSLRRLSLVTSIPVAWLVGENVKGLNSSGDNEQKIFNDAIQAYQDSYINEPINYLTQKLGIGKVEFRQEQAGTPLEMVNYERRVLENAQIIQQTGGDFETYLNEKGLIKEDAFEEFFKAD